LDNKIEKELTFTGFGVILYKQKWWFIGSFIFILIASLLFSFIKIPLYNASSKIKISDTFFEKSTELNDTFPEDMKKLWIFPNDGREKFLNAAIWNTSQELKSKDFLDKVAKSLNIDFNKLNESFDIVIDNNDRGAIIINTSNKNAGIALLINNKLLEIFINKKNDDFLNDYNVFLAKINEKIDLYMKDIDNLEFEKNKNDVEYDLENSKPLLERSTQYLITRSRNSEVINHQILSFYREYDSLVDIKSVFTENKNYFIADRIVITENPLVTGGTLKSYIEKSMVSGILIALIGAFAVAFLAGIIWYSSKLNKK
jgi:hypothetical protein